MGWQDAPMVGRPSGGGDKRPAWEAAPVVARPAGKPRKSELLGLEKGVLKPLDNMAIWLEGGAKRLGIDTDRINSTLGMPSASGARDAHNEALRRKAAQGVKPGLLGEFAGNVVGTAPALFEGPLVAGTMSGAALTDHPESLWHTALSAAGGMVGSKVAGKLTDVAADVLKPVVSPAVAMLNKAGVRMTPGQIKGGAAKDAEDKAMSRPGVGDKIAADRRAGLEDFSRAQANRALFPLGIKLPDHIQTGHDAVAFVQDEAGKAYDRIMPTLSLAPDGRVVAGLRKGWQTAQDLSPEMQERFKDIVSRKLQWAQPGASTTQPLTGRPLAVAIRDVKKLAAGFSQSADQDQRLLGEALGYVDEGLHSGLAAQNPGAAKALKAANAAYKGSRIVSDAAKGADEGIASTGQLKTAVRQNDRTKNQRATAAGRAVMQDLSEAGREVLPSKYPDSGTAGRGMADKLLPRIKGAAEGVGYDIDKALTQLRLLPRSAAAKKAAGLLSQYKRPISAAGGPLGGLLGGLFSDDQ